MRKTITVLKFAETSKGFHLITLAHDGQKGADTSPPPTTSAATGKKSGDAVFLAIHVLL